VKLIRDGLAVQVPCRPVRDLDEHKALMCCKMLEELGEVLMAQSKEDSTHEIGDLVEALHAYAGLHSIPWRAVERARREVSVESTGSAWDVQPLFVALGGLIGIASDANLAFRIATVIEMLRRYASHLRISWGNIEQARLAKRANRGGFDNGTVWDT
jgi:predicted house-cleaning noncanonical NTP pyrophosphatase (MazG superfamily)